MTTLVSSNHNLRAWANLLFFSFLIWVFGWVVGPYFENNIATYSQIVQVVEEQGINSAAYTYQESVGSYDGEYYLRDSLQHSGRKDYGVTLFFLAGIASCFIILGIGWRYIM